MSASNANTQAKPKKTTKHAYAATQHRRIATEPDEKRESERVQILSRSSSPCSSVVSMSVPVSVSVPVVSARPCSDSRVFQEVLNDMLHDKSHTHYLGKLLSDHRFDRLLTVCKNPADPSITRSERETIAHHKYVAGHDDRLFCWI